MSVQELSSGGGGPGHTYKKFDFFLSNYFTEGSDFKENNTVQSSRGGGGSALFRVDPTFSWRGWGPFAYSNGNL